MSAQLGKTFALPPHVEIGADAQIKARVTNDTYIHVSITNAAGSTVLVANLTIDAAHVLVNALTLCAVEQEQSEIQAAQHATRLWGHGTGTFNAYLATCDGHVEAES